MKKITKEELGLIIENHAKWLKNPSEGNWADLSRANLSGAKLYGAKLKDGREDA